MLDFMRMYQTDFMLFLEGVCLVLAFLMAFNTTLTPKRRAAVILLEITAAIYLVAARYYYVYKDVSDTAYWPLVRIGKFMDYFLALATLWSFDLYLKDLFVHEAGLKKPPVMLYISDAFTYAGAVMLIISRFTNLYYYWDSYNVYTHSKLFFLHYFFAVPPLFICLFCVIKYGKHLTKGMRIPLILFIVIPVFMSVLQLTTKGIAFAALSTAGMDIVLYLFTVIDMNKKVERAHRLEIEMMARYQKELEDTVALRTSELKDANEKVEHLLLNILPENIAKELTEHPDKTISNRYPSATVLFTDIEGFTKISDSMSAEDIVRLLNKMMTMFDDRAKSEGIEKIKTIGDAYMAVTGLTEDPDNDGAVRMTNYARGLIEDIDNFNKTAPVKFRIRIGINTGEIVAGVIGKTKFIYDVWGDTVNVASRMESSGAPMRIHVSESTYERIKDSFDNLEEARMDIKGKGSMLTYFMD